MLGSFHILRLVSREGTRTPTYRRSVSALRIAFFGSDELSGAALRLMAALQRSDPSLIATLDVVTRHPKRAGRGMKELKDVPIVQVAEELSLRLRRVETSAEFGALAADGYNLAIAVSYGKLIPASFLLGLLYGGLNVHPSLLPAYSGASPLQFALLNMDRVTGVTVQTLHPTKFDAGVPLLQSAPVPIHEDESYASLRDRLGVLGSHLLVDVVRQGLFVNPKPVACALPYSYAGKVEKAHAQIHWSTMSARKIVRYYRTLGQLFTFMESRKRDKKSKEPVIQTKRVTLRDVRLEPSHHALPDVGSFALVGDRLVIRALDGYLSVGSLTVEKHPKETSLQFVNGLRKKMGETKHAFYEQP